MKTLQLATALLLATQPAAIADSVNYKPIPKQFRSATAQEPAGSTTPSNLLRNANECAPDVAEPVWDTGDGRLSFSCHAPIN